jgi:hypothetical protein
MSSIHTLGRLVWRPAGWLLLFSAGLVSIAAGWNLAHGPVDLADAARYGESTRQLRWTVWRLVTLLPALVGMMLSLSVRELQHTFFAWTLPGLSDGLRDGKMGIGVTSGALLAFFAARIVGPENATAVFGWALLCFALGGVAFDPVLSKLESRSVRVILILLVLGPEYLEEAVRLQPLLFAAFSTLAFLLLLRREFSVELFRQRPLIGVSPTWATTPHGTRQYWARSPAPTREWYVMLEHNRLLDWLRSGYYEAHGGDRLGWVAIAILQLSIFVAVAYFLADPMMVVVMSWVLLGMSGSQLRAKFLYPLSRPQRATLFFVSTALETAATTSLALVAATILFTIGPAGNAPSYEHTFGEVASFIVFFFAWAPVGHWAKIREPWSDDVSSSVRLALRFLGFQVAYVVVGAVSAILFQRLLATPSLSWAALGILIAAIHATYWFAIRRHYRTNDLVFART